MTPGSLLRALARRGIKLRVDLDGFIVGQGVFKPEETRYIESHPATVTTAIIAAEPDDRIRASHEYHRARRLANAAAAGELVEAGDEINPFFLTRWWP